MLEYKINPHPTSADLNPLWSVAWGAPAPASLADILSRSLGHIGVYDGDLIVGFVNVAWDGGVHAFILDTCVHPDYRGRGIATRLVEEAIALARQKGSHWLHVDFEPHLEPFYRKCGFRPTAAGLIALQSQSC
ncbi:GNAT family N-acetyltransferase [Pleomorphomonas sp. PLEO]|uniref:GNAT family N-acetyltransferase n=1 Tax=Pleomorphomonas sp. PLEO TaxID=3239306 RepID=UPI00351DB12F